MSLKFFSNAVDSDASPKSTPRPDLKTFKRDDEYDVSREYKTNRTQPNKTPTPASNLLQANSSQPTSKEMAKLVFSSEDWVFTQATALCSLPLEEDGFSIPPGASHLVNGNGNAFSNEIIAKYYKSFIGAHNYVDHNQDPSESRGVIIDVLLRRVDIEGMENHREGWCYYVDILIATNKRKDPKWAAMVESGEVRYLSMGCLSSSIVCSKCGNISREEKEDCEHQTFELGLHYINNKGEKVIVAGLVTDDPDDNGESYVEFVEESYLSVDPAFSGAIQGHVLEVEPNTDVEVFVPRKSISKEAFQTHGQYIGGIDK